MYVCVCNRVTDRQIRQACAEGACSLDCLKDKLKVATCCGRCADCAAQLLAVECQSQVEVPPAVAMA